MSYDKDSRVSFVLVHGAWHGAWAWSGVIAELEAIGHLAYAPTIRGHGPGEPRFGVTQDDFVTSLVDYVESRKLTNVVLVAHSWGGFVVTPAVAALAPRLAGLVFLNALIPLDGQTMFDTNLPEETAKYRQLSAEQTDGSIPISWDRFRGGLMQEAPEDVARVVHRLLTPVPLETFSGAARTAGFLDVDIPRLYVFARSDIAQPRSGWEEFAGRIGPHTVAEMDGDHEGLFLYPDQVAKTLAGFAASLNAKESSRMPDTTTTRVPVVQARGVMKSYGSVVALSGVDLEIYPGEVLSLVGDNGAGKSTLLKILSGNTPPSSGELLVDGNARTFTGPAEASAAGIATVYQDLALAPDLSVIDNLFLGRELHKTSGLGKLVKWLDHRKMANETRQALDEVHIRIPNIEARIGRLSGGQRQAVSIARAAAWCDRVLLLDEPTAALGVEQQREVLNLIERLKDKGVGVVLVSHQLVHVLEVSDRIAVLRRGRMAGVITRDEATVERLLAMITGLEAETHEVMQHDEPAEVPARSEGASR